MSRSDPFYWIWLWSDLMQCRNFFVIVGFAYFLAGCGDASAPGNGNGPSPEKSPEDEQATFQLEPGLQIQLVASEPMVQDPVMITFDEDGRLWVVEMRGFMPDIDGKGENEKVGRISVLEDTDGDGVMDVSTVYIDSLIMPRALALVPGGALIVENQTLWLTQDDDHDLKADSKISIDPDYAGSPLPEHSGNGLWRGIDNWYYNVKSRFRYQLVGGKWVRDSTEFRGQWGVSHDNEGRLYYNYNWSQLHADLVPPNYLSRNKHHKPTTGIDQGLTIDRRVYPIRPNPAVNRGYIPGTLDETEHLIEFTAACSPFYYRATALPAAYDGNVFVCEPSGNLVKRDVVEEDGVRLSAHDPHPGREFLASTDERFRPVHLATGPDGALYLADMYRGLIQHGAYVTPYLREQTLTRKLVQPIHRGRIWRIVPEGWKPPTTTRLSTSSGSELIKYLGHPNGWYRDMAQKLLVERNDQSIRTEITQVALHGDSEMARFHALWTMEGLGMTTPALLFECLEDSLELLRVTALRLLEPLARQDAGVRTRLENHVLSSWQKGGEKEALQTALTAQAFDKKILLEVLSDVLARYDTSALMRDAVLSSLQNMEFPYLQHLRGSGWIQKATPEKEIFLEMLATAIVHKGDKKELTNLLSLLEVPKNQFGWDEKTILAAMSIQARLYKEHPFQLSSEPAVVRRKDMPSEAMHIAALETMFEWPGHKVASTSEEQTTLTAADQQQFIAGRQQYLTTCAGCHGTDGAGLSRFAPPLVDSDWVLGNERRLALIILHGLEGPVEVAGKVYDAPDILPVMPAHSTMGDGDITAIMTYIRNEWGNNATPAGRRIVGTTRHTSQGRVVPWTANELNKHILDTEPSPAK